jgi:tetratricopeptide (TPR) repeat protein
MAREACPSPYWRPGYGTDGLSPPPAPSRPRLLRWAERLVARCLSACNRLVDGAAADPGALPLHALAELPALGGQVDAVTTLNRTLALQPHNCLAWFQLGMVQLQQGGLTEAVDAFERAKRCGFATFELHFYLAEALAGLGRHAEAVEELYLALERQPRAPEPPYRLGLSLHELQRYDEAVAAFKIALSLSPNNVKYHQSLGLALERLGQQDEAIKHFKQAVQLERGVH